MKTLVLPLALLFSPPLLQGQELPDSGSFRPVPAAGFLLDNAPLREGYHMDLHGGYPVLNDNTSPVFGRIGVTIAGTLRFTYSNEGRVGNLLGMVRRMNTLEMRGQVLGEDQPVTLAAWIRGNVGWEQEDLGPNDIWPKIPSFYANDCIGVRYQYATTALGLTAQRRFTDAFTLNVSVGLQRLQVRGFLPYVSDLRARTALYEYSQRSWLLPDASIAALFKISPRLLFIAEATTLPYLNVNPVALTTQPRMAYNAALGIRWWVTSMVCVEAFLRTQTAINGFRYNEIRIGISFTF